MSPGSGIENGRNRVRIAVYKKDMIDLDKLEQLARASVARLGEPPQSGKDAAFSAASHTVLELIAEVRRLRAALNGALRIADFKPPELSYHDARGDLLRWADDARKLVEGT